MNSDPKEPMVFRTRKSPVSLTIGNTVVKGENWTDANLGAYLNAEEVFQEVAASLGSRPICSVDIEPFTLLMLHEKDKMGCKGVYESTLDLFCEKYVDTVVTLPFHPILPHLHPFEQRVLSAVMWEFYRPILEMTKERKEPISIWLPEGAFTYDCARTVAESSRNAGFKKSVGETLVFIQDSRQFVQPVPEPHMWSCNSLDLGYRNAYVFGRDQGLSDGFAFGSMENDEIVTKIVYDKIDAVKEEKGIPYLITMASDLEALLSDKGRAGRFRHLLLTLKDVETTPMPHAEFLRRKTSGEYARWKGELEADWFNAKLKDFSAWSDYPDMCVDGRTSDTRWTGLRRVDGLVISRKHGRKQLSQIWKQGYSRMVEKIGTIVRRNCVSILSAITRKWTDDRGLRFLIGYNRVVFRDHYMKQGLGGKELEFDSLVASSLGDCEETEVAALAGRAYYEMLMGNRSCPRFWENIDTRVTFQAVALLSHSLIDLMEAYSKLGRWKDHEKILSAYISELVFFDRAYMKYGLSSLPGYVGWETSEVAWSAAIQSEIPDISSYNVVQRAALFAGLGNLPRHYFSRIQLCEDDVRADTAHISGEKHGEWENCGWCEHRG